MSLTRVALSPALSRLTVLSERRHFWPASVPGGGRLWHTPGRPCSTPALLWSAWKRGASRTELAGILVISPLGTVAYFAYTAIRFDDPFAYFSAQSNWGGWDEHVRFYAELFLRQPREAIGGDPRHLVIVLNVALGILALGLLTQMRRVVDPGLMVFTILLVVVQFAFTWVSLGRYLLPAGRALLRLRRSLCPTGLERLATRRHLGRLNTAPRSPDCPLRPRLLGRLERRALDLM